jgi:integrase
MKRWARDLDNRAHAIDQGRVDLHVLPHWKGVRVVDVDLPRIMGWLDDLADGDLGPGSQRHCLGLLSRFMSWAVERGHAQRNPCRDIPPGRRPRVVPPAPESVPWIADDADVLRVMRALPAPFDAIFFVGNRSGARLGEILALRLSDLDQIGEGVLRIRYAGDNGDGLLKEAKHGPKTKYAPLPGADAVAVLGPIMERRRAAGAGPEGFLFVDQDGDRIDRHAVAYQWRRVRASLDLPAGLNFYRATRHSAVSRSLASGASDTEVAAMVGHASTAMLRHYNHHVRRTFSPILHAGLGLDGAPGAKVIPMAAHSPVTDAQAAVAEKGDEHAA